MDSDHLPRDMTSQNLLVDPNISSLLDCILNMSKNMPEKVTETLRGNMVTEIDRDELKQKLDHPKKSILVEALPAEHFRKLHLPGAINIPVDQVRSRAPELMPNKDMEVIVYCAGPACHASRQAADELTAMGYTNVRHYFGGKEDSMQAGLPVVKN